MGDYGEYITQYGLCPSWALSLGYGGVAAGAVLSNWGSAVRRNDIRLLHCEIRYFVGIEQDFGVGVSKANLLCDH